MKREFSKNTTEVFTKTIFHYVPEILKYIDEIKEARKRHGYSMRYLIMSEILMFLSEGISKITSKDNSRFIVSINRINRIM